METLVVNKETKPIYYVCDRCGGKVDKRDTCCLDCGARFDKPKQNEKEDTHLRELQSTGTGK